MQNKRKSQILEENPTNHNQASLSERAGLTNLRCEPSPAKIKDTTTPSHGSGLLVNTKQKGNAVLRYIREIPWKFSDTIVPDFEFSKAHCALFLSVRYHNLHPSYIHERIAGLKNQYHLRVLIVHADSSSASNHALRELAKICIFSDLTLIVCAKIQEIALYLESYKILENKPPDMLMLPMEQASTRTFSISLTGSCLGKSGTSSGCLATASAVEAKTSADAEWLLGRATDFLTAIKSVNSTDARVLMRTFGNIRNIMQANENDLSVCPGIGPLKTTRICRTRELQFKRKPAGKNDCPLEEDSDAKPSGGFEKEETNEHACGNKL